MAIDPGSQKSGFVVYSTNIDDVIQYGKTDNNNLIKEFKDYVKKERVIVLVEKPDYIAGNGKQRAGKEVIDAIFWAGRFTEAFSAFCYGRNYLKNAWKLKNDKEVIAFIKTRYPHVKLKADSWQAFLLVHSYIQNILPS